MRKIEDIDSDTKSADRAKIRLNVTVLPKTSNWLKSRGSASQMIEELVDAAMAGELTPTDQVSQKLEDLTRENEELKATISQLQNQLQKESEQRPDYQTLRDKILNSLKLGRQAPGYRSAVKALDRFIAAIQ